MCFQPEEGLLRNCKIFADVLFTALVAVNRAVLVITFVLARSLYDNNIQSLPNGTFSGMAALQTL